MGLGTGVVLVLVGIALGTGAVDLPGSIDRHADDLQLGWVLAALGLALILLALVLSARRTRLHRDQEPDDRPSAQAN